MAILRFVYTSVPTFRLAGGSVGNEVRAILDSARRHNPVLNVTGGLLFTNRFFFQVLEGSGPAIEQLVGRIADDERHCDLRQLSLQPVSARRFGAWSMAYVKADTLDYKAIDRLLSNPAGVSEAACGMLVDVMAGTVAGRGAVSFKPLRDVELV